jgi:replicative DNA helicase
VVQVGDAVRAVKSAAMAADLPVVLLSSLNRSSNLGGTPRTNWLRDSGDIEFVADTILMLHYPDDDLYEDRRHCDIHCVKQRNGPTGVAAATFDKKSTRFLEPKW